MGNALKVRAEQTGVTVNRQPASRDRMIDSCWESNKWALKIGLDRWWHVAETDHGLSITSKDGDLVRTIWRMIEGHRPDYVNWSKEKLDREYNQMRWFIRHGMSADDYDRTPLAR